MIEDFEIKDRDGDYLRFEEGMDERDLLFAETARSGVYLSREDVVRLRDYLDAVLGADRKEPAAGRVTVEVVPEIDAEVFQAKVRAAIGDAFEEIVKGVRG